MQHRLILPMVCCFAALSSASHAAPVTLDKSQAVGDARRDLGTGVCGTAINYKNMRLNEITEAVDLLNAPKTDMRIIGRTSVLFDNINFRNNYAGSSGEFTSPDAFDAWLPYSSAPMSMPQGNDFNIAFRMRGYLNITSTNGGQPIALGINCNDACSLRIGKSKMELVRADEDDAVLTGTRVRQVIFKDTGMYPVELIYFQNANEGFLEWARTNMPVMGEGSSDGPPAGDAINTFDKSRWKIITGSDLFSSIVGSNPACQECGATGMDCAGTNYCGDGLCQPCNVPDHCGPTCRQCPTDARLCHNDKCVQCTSDAMCPPGTSCVDGRCGPPTSCTSDNDCKAQGKICDPDERICKIPPMACTGDAQCPAGQICESGFCRVKPTPCGSDTQCTQFQYCDTGEGVCKTKNRYLYEGGLAGCSATGSHSGNGTGALAFFAVSLLALGALARRRSGRALTGLRTVGRASLALVPLFFCLAVTSAAAQTRPISLNAQQFRPAIGPENIFTVEGSRTPGKWVPMANVWFEYARQPLTVFDTATMMRSAIVPDMVTIHLTGGIGLTRWLSLGVDLPIVVYQNGAYPIGVSGDLKQNLSSAGIGDLRVVGKVRILDNSDGGFGLAFAPQVTFPTGDGQEFRGDDAVGIEPRFALDYKTKKGFIVALNLGVMIRTADQAARNVRVSHQARYGLGAYLPLPMGFGALAELNGATSFLNSESIYSPLEAYIGGRWVHRTGITVNLGGGPGLTPVATTAQARIFASIGYLPFVQKKAEPVKPPPPVVDLDPDRDGVIGTNDKCPTVWGPADNQGCPEVDTDKDGLLDKEDKCPLEPGPKENQGCPDTDRDKDGLFDRLDSCPDQPGPVENNGCPLADSDKDGIVDRDDKCPYEPGVKEYNGCPAPRKFINVTDKKIELLQKILFATNKADIKPASFDLLNEVVDVMKRREKMRVHIEGHTDIRGTLQWNMKLSQMRAESVKQYLIQKGVAAERLTSEGYGPTRPVPGCENIKTTECYDKNRRTEFVIVEQ
jgi:outer membrane protein OmpA-like peptidoglycan-associated protein